MSFIAPLLGIVGTGVSAIGQIKAGNDADAAAKNNAAIAVENAQIQEREQRLQDTRTISSGQAAVGASGVTMSGSPLDVMAESAKQAELNALDIRRGGQLTAQSQLLQGANAKAASRISAGSTILTGGVTAAKQIAILGNNKQQPVQQVDLTPTS